ncbi:hypothetical protein ABMY45_04255 [Pseudoalteromonas sp. XMcav11-Q]
MGVTYFLAGYSNGAAIIYQGSTPVLVGLAAWKEIEGDLEIYFRQIRFNRSINTCILLPRLDK